MGGPDATASGFRRNKRFFPICAIIPKSCLQSAPSQSILLSLRDPDVSRPGRPPPCRPAISLEPLQGTRSVKRTFPYEFPQKSLRIKDYALCGNSRRNNKDRSTFFLILRPTALASRIGTVGNRGTISRGLNSPTPKIFLQILKSCAGV